MLYLFLNGLEIGEAAMQVCAGVHVRWPGTQCSRSFLGSASHNVQVYLPDDLACSAIDPVLRLSQSQCAGVLVGLPRSAVHQ
jgi:hypothetical protein